MKTPYLHIYKVLRLNRLIVLAVLLMAFISSLVSVYQVRQTQKDHLENSFAIDPQGTIYPLTRERISDNLLVEANSHLDIFHRSFYHLSPTSYKENLEKALWLSDQTVDELYKQKKAEGIYNRLLQYGLLQKVTKVQSSIDLNKDPYGFTSIVEFEVLRGSTTDFYRLHTSGKLEEVARNFPYNPHGFVVTNFYEEELKKITDENR